MPPCKKAYATTMPQSMPCRGKSKCCATHLATSPLQACHNTHSKPIRDIKHEAANVANNRTKANRGNPAAAVVAPTIEAGETDSREATTPVTGLTPAAHSTAALAVTPPKAPQTLRPHSRNSTIGSDIHNNHTSATCAQPGVNHQHVATRSNMMGGNNKGILKTILPGAAAQCTPAAQPAQQPTNYTPTFAMPFGNNGPRFPTAPGGWGFGPHVAAYQRANNISPP
jgi:hypothetical protein